MLVRCHPNEISRKSDKTHKQGFRQPQVVGVGSTTPWRPAIAGAGLGSTKSGSRSNSGDFEAEGARLQTAGTDQENRGCPFWIDIEPCAAPLGPIFSRFWRMFGDYASPRKQRGPSLLPTDEEGHGTAPIFNVGWLDRLWLVVAWKSCWLTCQKASGNSMQSLRHRRLTVIESIWEALITLRFYPSGIAASDIGARHHRGDRA
jgi:hypothetical protein